MPKFVVATVLVPWQNYLLKHATACFGATSGFSDAILDSSQNTSFELFILVKIPYGKFRKLKLANFRV
jgi:hypothetical protein